MDWLKTVFATLGAALAKVSPPIVTEFAGWIAGMTSGFIREQANAMTRVGGWVLTTALLLVGIYYLAPQQLEVIGYKAALVTLAATLAYMIDRTLYANMSGTPTMTPGDVLSAARTLSRAIVLLAIVLGLTGGI